MPAFARYLAPAAVLLLSAGVFAQQSAPESKPQVPASKPQLLVRLSYNVSNSLLDGVCLSVSRDGAFRIVRSTTYGQMQHLEGKMPEKDLQQLKALLEAPDFRALSGNHSGLILQQSESFGAEIPFEQPKPGALSVAPGISIEPDLEQARRLQWLNGDGENPFPAPISKVVEWMKHFEPKNAKEFEYAEFPDVCPSTGVRLVQPAVAENDPR